MLRIYLLVINIKQLLIPQTCTKSCAVARASLLSPLALEFQCFTVLLIELIEVDLVWSLYSFLATILDKRPWDREGLDMCDLKKAPRMQMHRKPFAHDAVAFDSLLTSVKVPWQECRKIPYFTYLISIIIL